MANVQKIKLGKTDYWDNERKVFVMYSKNIVKSSGTLRIYDECSCAWWDSRIVSIKYNKHCGLYKYELEKI